MEVLVFTAQTSEQRRVSHSSAAAHRSVTGLIERSAVLLVPALVLLRMPFVGSRTVGDQSERRRLIGMKPACKVTCWFRCVGNPGESKQETTIAASAGPQSASGLLVTSGH